jgi:predicted nucleic acid-binding protein
LICYFDASALAKRYVQEEHSNAVNQLLTQGLSTTSRISEAELASAVARRYREGRLGKEQRDRLISAMQRDMGSLYVIEVLPEVSSLACRLLVTHKLRAADALHLASALLLARRMENGVRFVAFDKNLTDAARLEGLEIPSLD